MTPSWLDGASAAPIHIHLIGGWAHSDSIAAATPAMPWPPLWWLAVDPPLILRPPPLVGQRQQHHDNVDMSASWQH
jgi:hypothetical protein